MSGEGGEGVQGVTNLEQKSLFATAVRDIDVLTDNSLSVIDRAFAAGATAMLPLFSGGHDSLCACHLASQHSRFPGEVNHINTRIGAKYTRRFVEEVCEEYGWRLRVWESNFSYEKFVRRFGFPGPGYHQFIYNKIKDRCVSKMPEKRKVILLTGCRQQESVRRMGHVEAVKIGETSKKTGKTTKANRIWTAPCFDWSIEEQNAYMNAHGLPRNQLKDRLGMSGECNCGAYAAPGEYERIQLHAPDVAKEIDRLAVIARECGKHDKWGTRPPKEPKGLVVVESGPLCSGCEHRAKAAGVLFE